MNTYRLKISLVEPHYPINELHRIVEVSGNIRFDELHQEIFRLFERHDEHLWQFFIARGKMDSFNKLFNDCREHVLLNGSWQLDDDLFVSENKIYPTSTMLDELNLAEKEYIYYWFDFGDDWLHRIRIEKITQSDDADSYALPSSKPWARCHPNMPMSLTSLQIHPLTQITSAPSWILSCPCCPP